jgi:hypothetical protein
LILLNIALKTRPSSLGPMSREGEVLKKIRTLWSRNEPPTNGHAALAEPNPVAVPPDFVWSLEVRDSTDLVGTMYSLNPMALISHFQEYAVLYGDPDPDYVVWLSNKRSNRRAPLSYHSSEAAWIAFLRQLDPEIDATIEDVRGSVVRTTMIDPAGHSLNADQVFEAAFGQS